MLDRYFKYPILIDIILGLLVNSALWVLLKKNIISFPDKNINISMSTDMSTISLTLAGFVLTLLTIIITFKAAAKLPNDTDLSSATVFNRFFFSPYYGKTIELLKTSIVLLVLIAIFGFVLKLSLRDDTINYLFYSNCFGLLIILTTFLRCLIILNLIVKLQQD